MNCHLLVSDTAQLRKMWRVLIAGVALLLVGGALEVETLEGFIGYVLITLAAALPVGLWIRLRAPGVPILPAVAAFFYLYYAVPIGRENFGGVLARPEDVLRAAETVALFLLAATGSWWIIVGAWIGRSRRAFAEIASTAQLHQMIAIGLLIGMSFQVGAQLGLETALGTVFGVVRDVSVAVASIACYMIGYGRARGLVRGQFFAIAIGGMAVLIAFSWLSLLLIQGMQFGLAAMLGYVITSKRIPWRMAISVVVVLFILQAGKAEIRDRYWAGGQTISVSDMPELLAEWFVDGVQAIVTGETQQNLVDRASLLERLVYVQQLSPAYVPYLGGDSYQFLGDFLIPRFLYPDKPTSQAAMALLNIRYGVQTANDARYTSIGWGVVPEAYANFGDTGALVVGLLYGALAALFSCWSAGAPPLAMSTLVGVAALVTMIDVEVDLTFLLVNLWHAVAAMVIFFVPMKFLSPAASPSVRLEPKADLPTE